MHNVHLNIKYFKINLSNKISIISMYILIIILTNKISIK